MNSRVDKYYDNNLSNNTSSNSTRSGRNARLYKEVYGKYGDLDNLPIEDNTDEIDMERLKELISNSTPKQERQKNIESISVLEKKKRQIDEQRVYDINKILEKAKYENNKLKDTKTNIPKVSHSILSTLESNQLSLEEIQRASREYQKERSMEEEKKQEQLTMTREIKYQELTQEIQKGSLNHPSNIESSVESSSEDLSLDLFSDLKPTGNTIVTKPIQDEVPPKVNQINNSFLSSNTKDIDIIKPIKKNEESDFFTSSYEFSKKDFTTDEDFEDLKDKGGLLKIIFLIFAIFVFIGVIIYFVGTYGLGL